MFMQPYNRLDASSEFNAGTPKVIVNPIKLPQIQAKMADQPVNGVAGKVPFWQVIVSIGRCVFKR